MRRKPSHIHNRLPKSELLQFAVCFAGVMGVWLMVKYGMGFSYSNTLGTVIKAIGDSALILCWFWLLPVKWRWLGLVPVWGYAFWGVVNMAYFRFWNDLVPAASITMFGNVDGNLLEYGVSLLKISDSAYLFIPVCCTILFVLCPRKEFAKEISDHGGSRRFSLCAFLVCVCVGLVAQAAHLKTSMGWRNAVYQRDFREAVNDAVTGQFSAYRSIYAYNGPIYYSVRYLMDILEVLNCKKSLTEEDRAEISRYLARYERKGGRRFVSDSLNVVYIIVESLNSDMIRKEIGGRKIMPGLDSLSRLDGTVWVENVVSQTRASSSSDGHLLLLTGLMPPEKISYSITYGATNKYPSLADYMPRHEKRLLLADDGVSWNEAGTLSNFGLGSPVTSLDRPQSAIDSLGSDGAMFRQAEEMASELRGPFFMTLMTISMHIPFKEPAWPLPAWIDKAVSLGQMEKDYANACHQTDKYLVHFINTLPPNTIVFISSDHSQSVASDKDVNPYATMMAIRTPRTLRVTTPTGQANLFPAALDILQIGEGYGGTAPSALVPSTPSDYQQASRISDLIITGNFFK